MLTRPDVIERQRACFGATLPQHYNENLFLPLEGEDLQAFEEGDGAELQEKMRAPHSSAALCVNFFSYWKRQALPEFLSVLGPLVFQSPGPVGTGASLAFEAKHRFGRSPEERIVKGTPGNLDVDIRFGPSHALLVESKFTEAESDVPAKISEINTERYLNAFRKHLLAEPTRFFTGGPGARFYQLAQRLLYTVDNADEKFRSIPNRCLLFLYYDYEEPDRQLQTFPTLVRPEFQSCVRVMSYQQLFDSVGALERGHERWFEYMRRRYFQK